MKGSDKFKEFDLFLNSNEIDKYEFVKHFITFLKKTFFYKNIPESGEVDKLSKSASKKFTGVMGSYPIDSKYIIKIVYVLSVIKFGTTNEITEMILLFEPNKRTDEELPKLKKNVELNVSRYSKEGGVLNRKKAFYKKSYFYFLSVSNEENKKVWEKNGTIYEPIFSQMVK